MANPVKYTRKGNVHTIDFGIPALGVITIDYDQVPAENREGIAKALLSSATLACYVNTLGVALDSRDAEFESIEATATPGFGHNANNQPRLKELNLDVELTMPEAGSDVFERCQKIMKNGCLVTASVHEGIHMNYDLKPNFKK